MHHFSSLKTFVEFLLFLASFLRFCFVNWCVSSLKVDAATSADLSPILRRFVLVEESSRSLIDVRRFLFLTSASADLCFFFFFLRPPTVLRVAVFVWPWPRPISGFLLAMVPLRPGNGADSSLDHPTTNWCRSISNPHFYRGGTTRRFLFSPK